MKSATRSRANLLRIAKVALCSTALALAASSDAQARSVRYIASNGSDTNNCTLATPCRTLQRGIDVAAVGDEIIVLDSGDVGDSAVIRKSITITAIGVSATLGGPLSINGASAEVVLRGLRLHGGGAAANGITISAATAVHVVGCEIEGFGRDGIVASVTSTPQLFVTDSVVRNNGFDGLLFAAGAGGKLTVENSRFEGNKRDGIEIQAGDAMITRAIAAGNGGQGIVQTGAGRTSVIWTTAAHNGSEGYSARNSGQISLEESVARGNVTGLRVTAGSTARLSRSVVTNNVTGIAVSAGGTLLTRVNNTVSRNTTDVVGTLTPLGGV